MAHHEPPHQDLLCLQIQLFKFVSGTQRVKMPVKHNAKRCRSERKTSKVSRFFISLFLIFYLFNSFNGHCFCRQATLMVYILHVLHVGFDGVYFRCSLDFSLALIDFYDYPDNWPHFSPKFRRLISNIFVFKFYNTDLLYFECVLRLCPNPTACEIVRFSKLFCCFYFIFDGKSC